MKIYSNDSKHLVAVNCIIFGYDILEKEIKLLLFKRIVELAEQNGVGWRSLARLPDLIFDHPLMVKRALTDLQNQIKIRPVGFKLLPEKFTLVQLQDLYEAIYQRKVDKRNFRKKILSMEILEKLDEKERETSKKGAYYYKFNKDSYERLKQNGFYFNLDVN
jgi:8-oxo-dGTP diphosphatase